jgi:hypothetical protein
VRDDGDVAKVIPGRDDVLGDDNLMLYGHA